MKALSLSLLHWDKVSSPFGKGGVLSLSSFFISSSPPFPFHWDRVSSLLGKEGLRPHPIASPLLLFLTFSLLHFFPYPNVRSRRRRRDEEEEREEREEGEGREGMRNMPRSLDVFLRTWSSCVFASLKASSKFEESRIFVLNPLASPPLSFFLLLFFTSNLIPV